MPFDRSDFTRSLAEAKAKQAQQTMESLRQMQQASVEAEKLTGDPMWDRFLTYVQAAIENTRRWVESMKAMLEDPNLVGADDVARIRINIMLGNERIRAWQAMIDMPKEMIEKGEEAANMLMELAPEEKPQ